MKVTMLCICVSLLIGVENMKVVAQSKSVEQQKEEYTKGNRDIKFLKTYIQALKTEGKTEQIGEVVDNYLMVLPLVERYTGENLDDFMTYVVRLDAKSLMDVIVNWEVISFQDQQASYVVNKVDDVCLNSLFRAVIEKKGLNCSSLQAGLKKSEIPVSNMRRSMVDMWQFQMDKNIEGMIQVFERMMEELEDTLEVHPAFLSEIAIIGNMLNHILEGCNLEQCKKIYGVINHVLEKRGQKGILNMLVGYKDNFEGKQMMMEMGEE